MLKDHTTFLLCHKVPSEFKGYELQLSVLFCFKPPSPKGILYGSLYVISTAPRNRYPKSIHNQKFFLIPTHRSKNATFFSSHKIPVSKTKSLCCMPHLSIIGIIKGAYGYHENDRNPKKAYANSNRKIKYMPIKNPQSCRTHFACS